MNLVAVALSGGVGTRLWPVSQQAYLKTFIARGGSTLQEQTIPPRAGLRGRPSVFQRRFVEKPNPATGHYWSPTMYRSRALAMTWGNCVTFRAEMMLVRAQCGSYLEDDHITDTSDRV